MAETSSAEQTKITDLDEDALAHCASYLNLRDISNLALSCKSLRKTAYSDAIWLRLFRFSLYFSNLLETS